jgi:spore coat protein H
VISRRALAATVAATLLACGDVPSLPEGNVADPVVPPLTPPPSLPPPPPPCDGCQVPDDDAVPEVVAWPPLQEAVEALAITFPPSSATIVLQLWNDTYAPGRLQLGGRWYDVELRQRGEGSQEYPKHSWKTRHPKGELHDGSPGTAAWPTRTRNFLAEWIDASYLADPFSYGLLLGAGVRSPRWRYVTLDVNGEHQGVYVELQEVDKQFLRDHGFDEDSNVYRCGARDCELKLAPPRSYQHPWEKKTNESEPWDDLDAFLRGLNRTPEHELEAWLEANLDVDRFVRMYAAAILVSWSGVDDSGSFLVHDRVKGKWTFVPWDLNNAKIVYWRTNDPAWGASDHNAIPFYTLYDPGTIGVAAGKSERYGVDAHPPFVVLFQRAWDLPALRNRILDEVERMLDGVFSPAQANARIEGLRAVIAPLLARDPWVSPEHDPRAVPWLQDYVARRTAYLRAQLPAERRRGEGGLVVNAIGPTFLELHNRDDAPRDLGGLALTDDLRVRLRTPLPAGTVVPARGTITLPFAAAADGGEVGIFEVATQLPVDVAFYAPLRSRVYARTPEGAETWGWR